MAGSLQNSSRLSSASSRCSGGAPREEEAARQPELDSIAAARNAKLAAEQRGE